MLRNSAIFFSVLFLSGCTVVSERTYWKEKESNYSCKSLPVISIKPEEIAIQFSYDAEVVNTRYKSTCAAYQGLTGFYNADSLVRGDGLSLGGSIFGPLVDIGFLSIFWVKGERPPVSG